MAGSSDPIKAPFNMAIATLERIHNILTKIASISSDPIIPSDVKQSIKVQLVKDLFIQSCALLKPKVEQDIRKDFLELQPKSLQIIQSNGYGSYKKTDQQKEVYDWELEKKLNTLILKVQRELYYENYFMPPKKDPGRAVAEF